MPIEIAFGMPGFEAQRPLSTAVDQMPVAGSNHFKATMDYLA